MDIFRKRSKTPNSGLSLATDASTLESNGASTTYEKLPTSTPKAGSYEGPLPKYSTQSTYYGNQYPSASQGNGPVNLLASAMSENKVANGHQHLPYEEPSMSARSMTPSTNGQRSSEDSRSAYTNKTPRRDSETSSFGHQSRSAQQLGMTSPPGRPQALKRDSAESSSRASETGRRTPVPSASSSSAYSTPYATVSSRAESSRSAYGTASTMSSVASAHYTRRGSAYSTMTSVRPSTVYSVDTNYSALVLPSPYSAEFELARPPSPQIDEIFEELIRKTAPSEEAASRQRALGTVQKWTLIQNDAYTRWKSAREKLLQGKSGGDLRTSSGASTPTPGTNEKRLTDRSFAGKGKMESPDWYIQRFMNNSITQADVASLSVSLRTYELDWLQQFIALKGQAVLGAALNNLNRPDARRNFTEPGAAAMEAEIIKCMRTLFNHADGAHDALENNASLNAIAGSLASPQIPTRKAVAELLAFFVEREPPKGFTLVLRGLEHMARARGFFGRFDGWFRHWEEAIDGRGKMGSTVGASEAVLSLRGTPRDNLKNHTATHVASLDNSLGDYAVTNLILVQSLARHGSLTVRVHLRAEMEAAGLRRILNKYAILDHSSLRRATKAYFDEAQEDEMDLAEEMREDVLMNFGDPRGVFEALLANTDGRAYDYFFATLKQMLLIPKESDIRLRYFQLIDRLVSAIVTDRKGLDGDFTSLFGQSVAALAAKFDEGERLDSVLEDLEDAQATIVQLKREKADLATQLSQKDEGLVGQLQSERDDLERALINSRAATDALRYQLKSDSDQFRSIIARLSAENEQLYDLLWQARALQTLLGTKESNEEQPELGELRAQVRKNLERLKAIKRLEGQSLRDLRVPEHVTPRDVQGLGDARIPESDGDTPPAPQQQVEAKSQILSNLAADDTLLRRIERGSTRRARPSDGSTALTPTGPKSRFSPDSTPGTGERTLGTTSPRKRPNSLSLRGTGSPSPRWHDRSSKKTDSLFSGSTNETSSTTLTSAAGHDRDDSDLDSRARHEYEAPLEDLLGSPTFRKSVSTTSLRQHANHESPAEDHSTSGFVTALESPEISKSEPHSGATTPYDESVPSSGAPSPLLPSLPEIVPGLPSSASKARLPASVTQPDLTPTTPTFVPIAPPPPPVAPPAPPAPPAPAAPPPPPMPGASLATPTSSSRPVLDIAGGLASLKPADSRQPSSAPRAPPAPAPPGPPPPPGAPPPPMARVGGVELRKQPLDVAQRKMKQLQWDKVSPQSLSSTIWAKKGLFDEAELSKKLRHMGIFDELEDDFRSKQVARAAVKREKKDFLSVLDISKRQHIEILLLRANQGDVNKKIQETIEAIKTANQTMLDETYLTELKANLPDAEIIGKLNVYKNVAAEELEGLHPADRFLVELLKIPHINARVDHLLYHSRFDEQVGSLEAQANTIHKAASALLDAPRFNGLLQMILFVGNFMNATGAKGGAHGFKVSSINKLVDTKSATSPDRTLLHFVAKSVTQTEPDLEAFLDELAKPADAFKADLAHVRVKTAELRQCQDRLESDLKQFFLGGQDDADDAFSRKMFPFAKRARLRLEALRDVVTLANTAYTDALTLYGEDTKSISGTEEFFSIFKTFVTSYKKARQDNVRSAERAAKAAEIAAKKAEAESAAQSSEDSHDLVEEAMRKLREGVESSPRASRRERRQKQSLSPSGLRNSTTPLAGGDPAASAYDMLAALKGEGFDASTPPPNVSVSVPQSRRQRNRDKGQQSRFDVVSPIAEEQVPAAEDDTEVEPRDSELESAQGHD